MQKTYTHLTLEERAVMQVMLEQGQSLRAIARRLCRAPSSIAREFTRNNGCLPDPSVPAARGRPRVAGGYRCAGAQRRAQVLRSKARVQRKMVCGNAVWNRVIDALRTGLSPEQASGILLRMPDPVRISHESIYTQSTELKPSGPAGH